MVTVFIIESSGPIPFSTEITAVFFSEEKAEEFLEYLEKTDPGNFHQLSEYEVKE